MKVIFAGTPDFAAKALEAILAAGHDVPLVLTQPDRPAGRGMKLQASAVKTLALAHQLPVYQPERLKDPATHTPIRDAAADVMVVAAYGLILPQAVLDLPRHGCINIHASLLPRWRGAAPIHRAIEAGDSETGVTIMQMDAGLDTGAMLQRDALPITAEDTTGSLHDKLAVLGARLIVDTLAQLAANRPLVATAQPAEGVSYAHKIEKAEAKLDWTEPAQTLARKVRAFNPFPGAWAQLHRQGDEETLKIWRAEPVALPEGMADMKPGSPWVTPDKRVLLACGEGALQLIEVQRPGGRRISAADWVANSARH